MKKIVLFVACFCCASIETGYTNLFHSNSYQSDIIDKSIRYIQLFIQVTSELGALKDCVKSLLNDMAKISNKDNIDYKKDIKTVLKRLEELQGDISKYAEKQEPIKAKESNKDSSSVMENLAKLYCNILKLSNAFNALRDRIEIHVETLSHDMRNLNSTEQEKEEMFNHINKDAEELSAALKTLVEDSKKMLEVCDIFSEKNKSSKDKKEDNKTKK